MTLYPTTPQHRTGNVRIEMRYNNEHDRRIAHIHLHGAYRMARNGGLSATAARFVIMDGIAAARYTEQTVIYTPGADNAAQ